MWIACGAVILIFLIIVGIKYYQIENRYDETNGLELPAVTSVVHDQNAGSTDAAETGSVSDSVDENEISDADGEDSADSTESGIVEEPDESPEESGGAAASGPAGTQESVPATDPIPQHEPATVPTEPATPEPVPDNSVVEQSPVVAVPVAAYHFRNANLLNDHFVKHGVEMGFATAEAYEAAASAVITNPNSLYKIEAEDGDGVYYLEATNEFVILSTDGYIRTYFLPSGGKAYFDRQ